jgi:hypothetical protein
MLDVAAASLVLQVLRLVAAAAAALLAFHYTPAAMERWPDLLGTIPSAREIAFPAVIFAASYLVLSLIARLVAALVHRGAPSLSAADRLLGGLVGALKGVVIAWFAVSVALAAERTAGKPIPRLDTERSWVASVVRQCTPGRLADPATWTSLLRGVEPGGQGGSGR